MLVVIIIIRVKLHKDNLFCVWACRKEEIRECVGGGGSGWRGVGEEKWEGALGGRLSSSLVLVQKQFLFLLYCVDILHTVVTVRFVLW